MLASRQPEAQNCAQSSKTSTSPGTSLPGYHARPGRSARLFLGPMEFDIKEGAEWERDVWGAVSPKVLHDDIVLGIVFLLVPLLFSVPKFFHFLASFRYGVIVGILGAETKTNGKQQPQQHEYSQIKTKSDDNKGTIIDNSHGRCSPLIVRIRFYRGIFWKVFDTVVPTSCFFQVPVIIQ